MANLTVKGLPADIHQRLRDRAARNRRSLNAEVIACLEQAVLPRSIDVDALLQRAARLRARASGRLDDETIKRARSSGRP